MNVGPSTVPARAPAARSLPSARSAPPSGKMPERTLGPGRSASTATWRPTRGSRRPHVGEALEVLVHRRVRQVQPHDVDAGREHRVELVGRRRRRAEGGDDLGPTGHAPLLSHTHGALAGETRPTRPPGRRPTVRPTRSCPTTGHARRATWRRTCGPSDRRCSTQAPCGRPDQTAAPVAGGRHRACRDIVDRRRRVRPQQPTRTSRSRS